jgi:hypothetical protein
MRLITIKNIRWCIIETLASAYSLETSGRPNANISNINQISAATLIFSYEFLDIL